VHLLSCDVGVQISHQCVGGHPGNLKVFGFPFFAIFASQFTHSPSDSGSSYDLDLADAANVFVVNSIPQNIANDAPQSSK